MAKTKRKAAATRTQIIRTPAPIVRVTAPRAAPARRRSTRRVGGGGGGFGPSKSVMGMGLAGVTVGFAVKSGLMEKLPAIPVIGRIGTAALVLDYWGKRGGGDMVRNAAVGCAFLAGYQLGNEGVIHGDEDGEMATTQVIHDPYEGDDGDD